jgi:hypoxanthine phosphoribosyltransferase
VNVEKHYFSWEDYDDAIKHIVEYYKDYDLNCGAVYGLPRGGLPIAVSLSHRLNLPLLMNYYDRKIVTDKKILVVDDIADTGETLKTFDTNKNVICTFHHAKTSVVTPEFAVFDKNDKWIVYPWETKDSETIADYIVEENENG